MQHSLLAMLYLQIPAFRPDTNYKNAEKKWMAKGEPVDMLVHDFIDPKVPKAVPYGIYVVSKNLGYVNVGTDHDTSEFAVESIRGRWKK